VPPDPDPDPDPDLGPVRNGPGAGLYLHVPFCTSVCPYCDFAVLIAGDERRRAYLSGMEAEVGLHLEGDWRFDTLYLGGGTPSSLPPDALGRLLEALARLPVAPDAIRHLEVNPEDVTTASARAWRSLGFNFLSLGVQSFDDERLRRLGRRHSATSARLAFERLREVGFSTLSVDLIYGSPGDDPGWWRKQLEAIVELGPDHLSCYQLTIHQGTVLGKRRDRGELEELGDDEQGELFRVTHRVLADLGYEGYEVSNFARAPCHRSRHNHKYWRHEPYLGLGPSAHSFCGRRRWWNHRRLRQWQAAVDAGRTPVEGGEELSPAELALEALMLGLRTADGVDLGAVQRRWGVDLATPNAALLERLVVDGLVLRTEHEVVRPTLEGMAIADALARAFDVPSPTTGSAARA